MYLNTTEVKALANDIENLNEKISDSASEPSNAVSRLGSSWEGAAGTKAVSLFNSIKSNCMEAQYKIIADYIRFLRERVALGYEEVETKNTSLSEAFK
ncbi:MAG: hypothetical protein IKO47_03695 [Ruminococcus sp.]|nr:hypothetical protein [Ruminococcus sp.]